MDDIVIKHTDSDDDLSSPECLLPMQPVEDDYSSDDEARKKLRATERINYKDGMSIKELDGHKLILAKHQNSSQMLAEHVQYFFYIDYEPREPEIFLEKASVQECLLHAFKFAKNEGNNQEVKVNGKSINEICEYWEKEVVGFSWIEENDKSNFRDLSHEEFKRIIKFFSENAVEDKQHDEKWENSKIDRKYWYANFVTDICSLLKNIYKRSDETEDQACDQDYEGEPLQGSSSYEPSFSEETPVTNRDMTERSELVKSFLDSAGALLKGRTFRRNGQCKKDIQLFVQNPDLTKDNKLIEDRNSQIYVKPDGLLVRPPTHQAYRLQLNNNIWMLVIEVYGPFSESVIKAQSPFNSPVMSPLQSKSPSPTPSNSFKGKESQSIGPVAMQPVSPPQQPMNSPPQTMIRSTPSPLSPSARQCTGIAKPMRMYNMIASPEYCSQIRKRIRASIPSQCDKPHCVDKIAGQHVLQLFAMAQQSLEMDEKQNILLNESNKPVAKAVGLFIVNEFVYFTRLLLEECTMWYLKKGLVMIKDLPKMIQKGEKRPKMAYGNFRFDLTCANHRKAFIIFLNHIYQ